MSEETLEDGTVIVLDNSSYQLKVGYVEDELPQGIFPPFVGISQDKNVYVGDDAVLKLDELDVHRPLERGLITNWEDMEKVWEYAFTEKLKCKDLEDHPLLISENPLNPLANREKIVSVLFEKFKVPLLYLQMQPVLSVYGSGSTSGLVIEAGESQTNIMPVFKGFPLHSSRLMRLDIGGADLHKYMIKLLEEQTAASIKTEGQKWAIHSLQDKLCYVAEDYQKELAKIQDEEYDDDSSSSASSSSSSSSSSSPSSATSTKINQKFTLPDGEVISVGTQRFRVPESLFQPKSLLDVEEEGLHIMVAKCILHCEVDLRKTFYENIVLAGGVTMFPGFVNRLNKELTELIPSTVKFTVKDLPDRNLSAWVGGAILGGLPTFENVCITHGEYDEIGAAVVHTKCPR